MILRTRDDEVRPIRPNWVAAFLGGMGRSVDVGATMSDGFNRRGDDAGGVVAAMDGVARARAGVAEIRLGQQVRAAAGEPTLAGQGASREMVEEGSETGAATDGGPVRAGALRGAAPSTSGGSRERIVKLDV